MERQSSKQTNIDGDDTKLQTSTRSGSDLTADYTLELLGIANRRAQRTRQVDMEQRQIDAMHERILGRLLRRGFASRPRRPDGLDVGGDAALLQLVQLGRVRRRVVAAN